MSSHRTFLPRLSLGLVLLSISWISTLHAAEPAVTAASGVQVHRELMYARPAGQTLTLDIYQPVRPGIRQPMPVLLIFHGGGWLINNKSIMQQMASYISAHANIVVVNADYRLLSSNHNTTRLNQIVEDALGATLWVQRNIRQYQGDPTRVAVTGDSAGGHLAAMVTLAGQNLSSQGFASRTPGFKPSYLPDGESAETISAAGGIQVQAAVLSYAVFDLQARAFADFETAKNGFWAMGNANPRGFFGAGINVHSHPELYRALSPLYLIPKARERQLPPQFVHVGSRDALTTPDSARQYVEAVKRAGHHSELHIYPGLNHAFLDNDCNEFLGNCFDRDAKKPLDDIIRFLLETLASPAKPA
ncbi:MAG: alpha/beta hydrolase [Rheinheimera sp.]|nr:alpha/beta hydrolase [Rheinheimera sp.]